MCRWKQRRRRARGPCRARSGAAQRRAGGGRNRARGAGAEFGSLEEADAEAQGAKKPGETTEGDIEEEVEMDETLDDAAFIEEREEEDADVTDIIGGDIENEEEG